MYYSSNAVYILRLNMDDSCDKETSNRDEDDEEIKGMCSAHFRGNLIRI